MDEKKFVILKFGGTSVSTLVRWHTIKKIIQDVTENGVPGVSNEPGVKAVLEYTVTYNGKTRPVRVIYRISDGSIITAFPID